MGFFEKKPSNLTELIAKARKDLEFQLNDFKNDLKIVYPKKDIPAIRPGLSALLDTLGNLIGELSQPIPRDAPAECVPQAPAVFTKPGNYSCSVDAQGIAIPSAFGDIAGWQSIVNSHRSHFEKKLDNLVKLQDKLGGPAASAEAMIFGLRLKMIRNASNGLIKATDDDILTHGV